VFSGQSVKLGVYFCTKWVGTPNQLNHKEKLRFFTETYVYKKQQNVIIVLPFSQI